MKTTFDLTIRAFPVKILYTRTGEESKDFIVLDKQRLQAAQQVAQSSKELIERIYTRQGFQVLDIGKPVKFTMQLRLDTMFTELTTRDANIPFNQMWQIMGGDGR